MLCNSEKIHKVYISAALTQIENPIKSKEFYERIGSVCDAIGFHSYVPHLHTDPVNNPDITPREVFEHDTHQVTTADLLIAYLGFPSFGVGMELAYAQGKNIPIILLYEKGKKISRYPRGIPCIIAEIQFNSHEEALIELKSILEKFKSNLLKTDVS
jgi:2'-deoxynucleoside 5'-phosphate N-hydrolase